MNPYDMAPGLYVDPDSRAWRWVNSQPVTPDRWLIKSQIAMKPMAKWIGPGDPSWVGGYLSDAARQQLLPVLVAYAIPFRDVGQHSAGGWAVLRRTCSGLPSSPRSSARNPAW